MTNNTNFYVDIHALQTVPPSCVNRDDTGSPKTAVYGGAPRARVSSQAWKRAMRLMFRDLFSEEELGKRTKRIVAMVAQEISALDSALDGEELAQKALENAGLKIKEPEKVTDALFFMSRAQGAALAALAVEGNADKKAYKEALAANPSVDMALFGRMVAKDQLLNYDAAAQVAHSISTHAVHNEYDYFTAVDDCSPGDNAGAGHLGTVEFNSSTLYRYATVNVMELAGLLGAEAAPRVVRGFVEAFVRSMPTGKQNTFANRTLPDAVYVALRTDQPVNLSGAFEKPVVSKNGYVEESEARLTAYAEKTYAEYVEPPYLAFCVGEAFGKIAQPMPFSGLLDAVEAATDARLRGSEVS